MRFGQDDHVDVKTIEMSIGERALLIFNNGERKPISKDDIQTISQE